jgi:hypothetical protein
MLPLAQVDANPEILARFPELSGQAFTGICPKRISIAFAGEKSGWREK